ncbi:hypothetical protein VV02_10055 [Luteipulveratus mongoliensis]|uniref:Barstar (barnase inhibitor) domain-containing protein n=1 Tax=Luteipulveratus mongoliensis TaxID=571913 RepID=A0A0K1JQ11_9MICO|nr:hypothetical protein VV02_10055 [Luteipulveratus mongoliensis]
MAGSEGWRTVHLDTGDVSDKAGLMDRVQRAFQLPDWFGRNWDALADALSDVRSEPGVLVAWTGRAGLDDTTRRTTEEILTERADDREGAFVAVLLEG